MSLTALPCPEGTVCNSLPKLWPFTIFLLPFPWCAMSTDAGGVIKVCHLWLSIPQTTIDIAVGRLATGARVTNSSVATSPTYCLSSPGQGGLPPALIAGCLYAQSCAGPLQATAVTVSS